MGLTLSMLSSLSRFWNMKRDVRIVMIGLDAAGKSTILYKLKLNETVTTIPTIGFNVETVEYKNLNMTVWDIGGQETLRKLWRHYYRNTDGVIFVVDSADHDRLEDARETLSRVFEEDELRDAVFLIYANKQDLPGAVSISELSDKLGLHGQRKHKWYVQGASATTGAGLYEGLDWLSQAISERPSAA